MKLKRWINVWEAEMFFLTAGIIAALILFFVVWQSEAYKKGAFVNKDTVWYSVTLAIHYPDKAKVIKIRTCRFSEVRIKWGANSFNYTDSTGYHVITSLAPIEIVDFVKLK